MSVKFTSNLAKVKASLEKAIDDSLEKSASAVLTEAQNIVPVDTGQLKESLSTSKIDKESIAVGSNEHYAPHVELGTVKQRSQPFLKTSFTNRLGEVKEIFASNLRKL